VETVDGSFTFAANGELVLTSGGEVYRARFPA